MKQYALDFTLLVHGLPFSGKTIPEGKSLGGSETAGLQMAEALARKGHHVTVFCNTEENCEVNGVTYQSPGWVAGVGGGQFPKGFFDYARSCPTDILVIQRLPVFFQFETRTKVNLLWQHDLATRMGPSNFHGQLWNVDRVMVLSEFMRKQYQSIHGGPDSLYHVTRNGIDLNLIDSVPAQERDRFRLTYTARPERGLDILLRRVFPKILEKEPRAKLYLSRYQDVATLPLYQELEQDMKRFGDRVQFLGNLGKKELYENFKKSRAYIYPSAFEEVSCLTAMETFACGTPFVGPWRGALPETCEKAGILIKDDGGRGIKGDAVEPGFRGVSDTFVNSMAEWAVKLMHDDNLWKRYSDISRQRAEQMTWDGVADDWVNLCHELISERTSNPRRLLKHFLVNSDVVAARKLASIQDDDILRRSVDNYVNSFVPFLNAPTDDERKKQMADFYEQRSGGDGANWQTAFWADREPRLQALIHWMRPKVESGEIKSVLDFGCAHGGYARCISNAFPSVKVVGVDVAQSLIRAANELKVAHMPDGSPACAQQSNLAFCVADEDCNLANALAYGPERNGDIPTGGTEEYMLDHRLGNDVTFDLVVALEVLEHVPDSEVVAKKLERHCRKDGYMAFTVPSGHRERDEFVTKGVAPVHVRSFDLHDLRDIFGKKDGYSVASFSDLQEATYDKSMSNWFMVTYQNTDKPLGEIDYERKFFLQGPRETVSVCMIANNSEDTMLRCLNSIKRIADQIIIVDNGPSTDRTVEFASEYAEVRPGTSPFWCYTHLDQHAPESIQPGVCDMAGFETPRNESIAGAWGDHVLWLDMDEQILDWANIFKYFRPNAYLGYATKQHHISVDPPNALRTDIPCRIFRNNQSIHCIGKCHEHFELGVNKGLGNLNMVIPDIHIHHDGYLVESVRRGRFKRNLGLLDCDRIKYPDRLLGIYLRDIRDSYHLAMYAREQSGGRTTEEVVKHCRTVVNTYRKYFMDKPMTFQDDCLKYYSGALELLGEGLEFCFNVNVAQQGAQFNSPEKRFRASDREEAKKIIHTYIDQASAMWEGPYVQ